MATIGQIGYMQKLLRRLPKSRLAQCVEQVTGKTTPWNEAPAAFAHLSSSDASAVIDAAKSRPKPDGHA